MILYSVRFINFNEMRMYPNMMSLCVQKCVIFREIKNSYSLSIDR